MKKLLFAAMPLIALIGLTTRNIEPLPLGSPIPRPEIKMKDISGKDISLNEAKTGKGLLVMFTCNTCPYVIKNQDRTHEVCKYALSTGIGVALLNSNEAMRSDDESLDEMKTYARNQQYYWYYLMDKNSVMADAFGANRTPECFLFDGNGKLVYHGAIDDNPSDAGAVERKHLMVALEELKDGKDISVKESRSVGCSIKRLK